MIVMLVMNENDLVLVRNYHSTDRRFPGVVTEKTRPVTYEVTLTNGQERSCHLDQLRRRMIDIPDLVIPSLLLRHLLFQSKSQRKLNSSLLILILLLTQLMWKLQHILNPRFRNRTNHHLNVRPIQSEYAKR